VYVYLYLDCELILERICCYTNLPCEADKLFQFHAVSAHEIHRINIMSFSSNKAPGHDNITMSVIKDSLPCILPVLTDIVNWFLLSSVFPSHLNISEVDSYL